MKVLHVITSLDSGGAEGVLTRLCIADRQNVHEVICLMGEGVYGSVLRSAGIPVRCVGMPRGKLTPKGLFRLWRYIRVSRPDVLQTWMYHGDFLGGLVGRLAGIRSIVWGIRNTELEPGKSSRSTIMIAKLCARLSSWLPARIAVCAEKAVNVHVELGYTQGKMVIVPNGYDLSRFRPVADCVQSLKQELGIPEGEILLGMVARFDPFKDHSNLISALGSLHKQGVGFHCLMVGGGIDHENNALALAIEKEGLSGQVTLAGRRSDIPVVMNALDVHVLSSSSEAFPNVIAEAMACGTPCVSTDVGDAALIVGETGWVVEPENPDCLAEALMLAIEERSRPRQWLVREEAARKRIEESFSMERMVSSFDGLWQEVYSLAGGDRE